MASMNFRPRHISEDQFKEMESRVKRDAQGKGERGHGIRVTNHSVGDPSPKPIYKYKGYRSKLEYSWANYLNGLVALGSIANFYYEPLNIRLPGKKNFYNPDFMVIAGDGMTFYEIKGRNKSDDRSLVKIKTAAGIHKWAQFVVVKWIKGQ